MQIRQIRLIEFDFFGKCLSFIEPFVWSFNSSVYILYIMSINLKSIYAVLLQI